MSMLESIDGTLLHDDSSLGEIKTNMSKGAKGRISVELVNLHRRFGQVNALDGFSLKVDPGELIALLGPSGSGKTTALRALAGLESVDKGLILVGGRDITHVPAHRRDMGMVFQAYSLFPNMTALDNVAFGLRIRKVGSTERRRRAVELLDLVGLSREARRYPHQLSGGQQQRVALARALAIEPRVLLLDEPLSALDATVRARLRDEIRRIQLEIGTTTVFVTHDQQEAMSIADRVAVMRDGKLEQVGTPFQIYYEPVNSFVASFVGSVNRLSGVIAGQGWVKVLGVRVEVASLGTLAADGRNWPAGTSVDVLVRPEALSVVQDLSGRCQVTSRTFLGALLKVGVAVPGYRDEIFATMPAADAGWITPGEPVRVVFSGDPLFITASSGT